MKKILLSFFFFSYKMVYAESFIVTEFDYGTKIVRWQPSTKTCYEYSHVAIATNQGAGNFIVGSCYSDYQAIFPDFWDDIPNDYAIIDLYSPCEVGYCTDRSEPFSVFGELLTPTPQPTETPIPTLTPSLTPTPSIIPKNNFKLFLLFPSNNLYVQNNTKITMFAAVLSHYSIIKVEFYVNGKIVCVDKKIVSSCTWKLPKGKGIPYSIFVKAYDSKGNIAESKTVIITSK